MPKLPAIGVPIPVRTGAEVSLPALNPTTPPAGTVVVAPSAPNTSAVPSVSTLPLTIAPSTTLLVSACAVGTSSTMLTVIVPVALLPLASVTLYWKLSATSVLAPLSASGLVSNGLVSV